MSALGTLTARAASVVLPAWAPWAAAVLVGASLVGGAAAYHHHVYQQGYDAAVSARAAQDASAVFHRVRDNAALSIKQDSINAILTKVKNEELAPVITRIVTQRVRVGDAICGGPATPAKTEDAAGSDRADPPGRLVRPNIERDLVALKMAVEQDLATGRSCQAWGAANGFIP